METASVATARNQLSRLLQRVKRGETIVITERNRPIARLQPIEESGDDLAPLYAAGLLIPPCQGPLKVSEFLAAPRARLTGKRSLSAAIQAERKEGR